MKKYKILFMGSSFFSESILNFLLKMNKKFEIIGIVCQPDRKINRKKEIIISSIKKIAYKYNIPIFQPINIIEILEKLKLFDIDIILTCSYGQILPREILNLSKINNLNIHASLLPLLRGGAPIHWAIIKNFKFTGITLIKMVDKIDSGAIYIQKKIPINNQDTYLSLSHKLIILSQNILKKYLFKIVNNEIKEKKQNENKATFAFNIKRSDEKINWNLTAQLISCHVRGLYNTPIAYTTLNEHIYKIHQVEILNNQLSSSLPGTIISINKLGIIVSTKTDNLIIKFIQPSGKKVINSSYYYGSKKLQIKTGFIFK